MFTKHELETILYTLEGYIQGNDDDKLCDELEDICNKIVEELDPPKVTITPQQLEWSTLLSTYLNLCILSYTSLI